jgi:hypothetical protein
MCDLGLAIGRFSFPAGGESFQMIAFANSHLVAAGNTKAII